MEVFAKIVKNKLKIVKKKPQMSDRVLHTPLDVYTYRV